MTREEKYLARLMFRNRALSADGQAFQDLFVQVMQCSNPNFRPVKPQGPLGDKKNDGFDSSSGQYYQVYGPEDLLPNVATALTKLKESFQGLLEYWHKNVAPIKEYYFVINDKYKGAYPEIERGLADLERKNHGIKCRPYLLKDLEDVFIRLSEDKIISIIGCVPDVSKIEIVDFSVMAEVIKYLMGVKGALTPEIIPASPDFEKKITFNKLSVTVALLLRFGDCQKHIIEDYFRLNSGYAKSDLRDIFSILYADGVKNIPGGEEKSDSVFFYILNKACPREDKSIQDAALVLMAYYFEYCDIFEIPNS